jgi:DNA-binding PadR family transcriptional regulator
MARKAASLEVAVLGLLHESPLHGYELRKRLNLLLGWGRLLSYGSLYPALKRLLRAGWITEVTAETPGVSRRQRIVYQITPAGRQYFGQEITDSGRAAWEDDNVNLRFAFFSRTDADIRLRILEGRRTRLQERLDRARYAAGGDDRYLSELRRHSIESVEREVRWLTDLINAERSNDQPGRVADAPAETGDAGPGGTTPTSAAPVIDAPVVDAAADATT